jgi:diguanylate cyclase (GGDEF)-like protein
MKVILAEDEPVTRRLLHASVARWGYDVEAFADGRAAWKCLECATEPTLLVVDWMMPGLDGLELCRRVRTQGREPYVYILMVTGRTDRGDIIEGLKAGADDFMVKPVRHDELKARLSVGERIVRMQTELVAARQAMVTLATVDSLTGLPNRSTILTALAAEINRAAREGTPISVCLADLDHFKRINDTFGHAAGDMVLREASARLQVHLRSYQAVGRLGGEEFLMVLPNCDATTAQLVVDRARTAVSDTPVTADGKQIQVTCSFGVTTFEPDGAKVDPLALVQTADRALYDAKANGRNCVAARAHEESATNCYASSAGNSPR